MGDYWNHNTHYHPLVLRAVPPGCGTALDVGCGDGLLARKLAGRAERVIGIDRYAPAVEKARSLGGPGDLTFVEADFLTWSPPEDGVDFVSFVATIHHMDFTAALKKAEAVLRPGGALAVVGLALNATLADWAFSALGLPATRIMRLRNRAVAGGPDVPILDADMSWGQVRRAAGELLPGSVFRKHVLWRYSLTWRKPY
ncbi:class I SAM-dependent methyltransferase [Planobispora siamensis]|uniref:Methyltransferase n=1 Tax=Planobispora siamensis TaxID=936338 RepID=A0A8J3WN93_9ACTN|nr:class I SAM-dependent methyltransferase [Planobispora siamensis]GIH93631.1 methyltransferase [Planobispora siamensis]